MVVKKPARRIAARGLETSDYGAGNRLPLTIGNAVASFSS